MVGFSEPARAAKSFEAYRQSLQEAKTEDLQYVGIALVGPKEKVAALSKGLPLLR